MNSTALTKKPEPPIVAIMRQPAMIQQLKAALPRHVTPERMARLVMTCFRNTPKLTQCDQTSVLAAVIELAQLGLEPSTPLGHAYILPYGNKAQVIIGYKGYISLADRSGIVLTAEVVYESDTFEYELGTSARLMHKPSEGADRGARRCAYGLATFPDKRTSFKVVTPLDIQHAKDSSSAWKRGQQNQSKRDSPWYTNEESMWRKTGIRRLAPFLPLSAEFMRAVTLDAQADQGLPQAFDFTPAEVVDEGRADVIERELEQAKAKPASEPQRLTCPKCKGSSWDWRVSGTTCPEPKCGAEGEAVT